MQTSRRVLLAALLAASLPGGRAPAEPLAVEHPFILWTPKDLAALRAKVQSEPWAQEAYRQMAASAEPLGDEMRNLFRYAVMGDKAAGEAEKKKLLALLKAPHPLGASMEFRVLAYDLLYGELSPQERRDLEAMFRRYIEYAIKPGGTYDTSLYNNDANYARYDGEDGRYTRTNWLPNIIFPWKLSANLMALALRDEKLIRETWAVHGSLKYYFDEYLCDVGFYSEEFSKMGATPGALLLYCLGAEHLGLDGLGFGYTGKGGATMRGHIESVIHLTYPRIDLASARPQYPKLTIGDVRPWMPLQQATVEGYFAGGQGGNELWRAHGAWGGTTRGRSQQWDNDKTEKMQIPLWFELAHRKWPDAGFDYFLAQMRRPGQDKYYPTLLFGLDPIDPAKARPPRAASAVWPERGLVMLRAEEGPGHWESPAPAAALRLTTAYAHHVNDALALCGLYAFNRPIYMNPKSDPGYAFGYSRSVRSHASVMVDGQVKVDDWGRTGSIEPQFTDDCTTRHAFEPEVKFVAARTRKRYEGVDETRALLLTREYLLDVFDCASARPRSYVWILHTFGRAEPEPAAFRPSSDLADLIRELTGERSLRTGGQGWSVTVRQVRPEKLPAAAPLPDAWYSPKIGVRMTMLGQEGVTAYLAATPKPRAGRAGEPDPPTLVDGVTILAAREAPQARFVALHEPFKGDPRVAELARVAETADALAVAVRGSGAPGVNDRLLLRIGDGHDRPVTLAGGGEDFTFADYGFVRIEPATVTVRGSVRAMKVRVGDTRPQLIVNGRPAEATVAGGILTFGP